MLWHRIINDEVFWLTKFQELYRINPLTEKCFGGANISIKVMALRRYRIELHHFFVGGHHIVPNDPFILISWGDQLCREAEHSENAEDKSWLMFFGMQQYASAVSLARQPSLSLSSSSVMIWENQSSPSASHDPEAVALLHWSDALFEVARDANPADRAALESLADEKLLLAESLAEIDDVEMNDTSLFGGFSRVEPPSSSSDSMDIMLGLGWS